MKGDPAIALVMYWSGEMINGARRIIMHLIPAIAASRIS